MLRLFARLQVAPGGEDVHVNAAAALAVLDRRPGVAVRFEPGPGGLLELLRVGRPVLGRLRDHAGRVLVPELEHVGDGGHHFGVSTADLDAVAQLGGRVPFAEQVVDGRRRGAD